MQNKINLSTLASRLEYIPECEAIVTNALIGGSQDNSCVGKKIYNVDFKFLRESNTLSITISNNISPGKDFPDISLVFDIDSGELISWSNIKTSEVLQRLTAIFTLNNSSETAPICCYRDINSMVSVESLTSKLNNLDELLQLYRLYPNILEFIDFNLNINPNNISLTLCKIAIISNSPESIPPLPLINDLPSSLLDNLLTFSKEKPDLFTRDDIARVYLWSAQHHFSRNSIDLAKDIICQFLSLRFASNCSQIFPDLIAFHLLYKTSLHSFVLFLNEVTYTTCFNYPSDLFSKEITNSTSTTLLALGNYSYRQNKFALALAYYSLLIKKFTAPLNHLIEAYTKRAETLNAMGYVKQAKIDNQLADKFRESLS